MNNLSVEEMAAEIAANYKKATKWSVVLSIVFLLLGVGWLVFSFYQVNDWRSKVAHLQDEEKRLNSVITQQKNDAETAKAETDKAKHLLDLLNPMLKKYGLYENLTEDALTSKEVIQSLEANVEIHKLTNNKTIQSNDITLDYYVKKTDAGRVQASLSEVGFKVNMIDPIRPDLPTNSIGYGKDVPLKDLKLAVYVLIRAGVEIKDICQSRNSTKSSIIQVVGDARILSQPSLTVEDVKDHKEYPLCRTV